MLVSDLGLDLPLVFPAAYPTMPVEAGVGTLAVLGTQRLQVVLSANIADGGEATTSYGLTAPGAKSGSDFTTGQRRDDANLLTFTPSGADKWTKVGLKIQPTADVVSNGQTYKFRLVRSDGTPLDTYSVTPKWTIGTPPTPSLLLPQSLFQRVPALRRM